MLVSKFNLSQQPEEEEEEEIIEPTPEPEPIKYEIKIVEDEPPKRQETVLKKSQISINLSMLGKTADGDGYTYLKATCTGMGLTNIDAIKCFRHLQYVDVSDNRLTLDDLNAVAQLPFLIFLQANNNQLTGAALKRTRYLQVMILNNNEINTVHDVFQTELSTLELAFNRIEELKFENRMEHLRCIDVRNNKIKSLANIDLPMLDSLYLANNKITSLVGVEQLKNLRVLHVRNNPIKQLDGFTSELEKLEYINLRNTKVSRLKQIKRLQCLKSLKTLILIGTPFFGGSGPETAESAGKGDEEEDPELRIEVLAALQRLTRLNKTPVTREEREEAKKLLITWVQDGEKLEDEEQDDIKDEDELDAVELQ